METIWLEIDGNEMMANDFVFFLEFLNAYEMKYAFYYAEDEKKYIEVKGDITDEFDKVLSRFTYYQPIIQLDEEPEISDIDLIEEMSNMD